MSWLLALAAAWEAVMLLRSWAARAKLAADRANCACSAGLAFGCNAPAEPAPDPEVRASTEGERNAPTPAAFAGPCDATTTRDKTETLAHSARRKPIALCLREISKRHHHQLTR